MEKIVEEAGRKFWVICVNGDEVFSRVSLDSNYREHVRQGGNRYVMLDDDRSLFDVFFKRAVAKLWLKLGRMSKTVRRGIKYSDEGALLTLEVSSNHVDNMLFDLGTFIERFVDFWVLLQWYDRNNLKEEVVKCEKEAEEVLQAIVTLVHYRRKAVKRPIDPLF